jgi:hypothetical protein
MFIRPDFEIDTILNSKLVSLLYKREKDGGVTDTIDGYMEFNLPDNKPVLDARKIQDDKLILATLSDGKVLYIDSNGLIFKEIIKR